MSAWRQLDWQSLRISLQVTVCAILLVVPTGILAAWFFVFGPRFPGKRLVENLLMLPLVLPPTVVGYYLLLLLGRGTPFGMWLNDTLAIHLLFSWQGAVAAAFLMALPLFLRSATAAFTSVDRELLEAGRTMGAGEFTLLVRITLPLANPGLFAGIALSCARALGEFGATMMVAGAIPGSTETLPLALYAAVQSGDSSASLAYTVVLTITAVVLLGIMSIWQRKMAAG